MPLLKGIGSILKCQMTAFMLGARSKAIFTIPAQTQWLRRLPLPHSMGPMIPQNLVNCFLSILTGTQEMA